LTEGAEGNNVNLDQYSRSFDLVSNWVLSYKYCDSNHAELQKETLLEAARMFALKGSKTVTGLSSELNYTGYKRVL
jgi:hypothetical protein